MKNQPRPYNDLMGDIIKKHEEEGGMENLRGQGKPLPKEYFSGDTFQHFQRIAKYAGYKPRWLILQQEISEEVEDLVNRYEADRTIKVGAQLEKLNEKIFTYNQSCPSAMQKGPISVETLQKITNRKS